jgi:predicted solute-binding protein
MKAFLSENEIISYWNMLDYELSDEHKKGLNLFRDYLD